MAGHDASCGAEQARFWRDPELDGTEFLLARFVSHHFSPHVHDEYAIGLIENGVEAYRYRGHDRVATAGEVVIVEPGEAHTGERGTEEGWQYRMFYIPARVFAEAAEAAGVKGLPHFRQTVLRDPALAFAMRAMHVASERGESQLERESRFAGLLTTLVERHAEGTLVLPRPRPDAPAGILRAIDRVEADFAEPLTLGDLAQCAGMSDFHFARLFARTTGMSPHRYVVQRRVTQACRLLRGSRGPMALADVAATVGFADQAHLTRHFKRITGVTPARFALRP
ncbi:AraC family ligand binding domain-containing protein [Pendulispora albinea]|uniref:AraC family transcriptional regulator n=1 Tax=Pendulispora albinea TaxID=2741071 RepID=A0ABZ2M5J1_9BACT